MKRKVIFVKKLSVLLLTVVFLLSGLFFSLPGDTNRAAAAEEESITSLFLRGAGLFSGITYDFTVTGKHGKSSGKMWSASPKMRIDMNTSNKNMSIFLDPQTSTMYTYFPAENRALKLTYNVNNLPTKSAEAYIKDIAPEKIKELPRELYDGFWCRVLLRQDERSTKMWVREDLGLPVRVEISEAGGSQTVVEFRNFYVAPLAADILTLPPGVQIMDMGGGMGGFLNRLVH